MYFIYLVIVLILSSEGLILMENGFFMNGFIEYER